MGRLRGEQLVLPRHQQQVVAGGDHRISHRRSAGSRAVLERAQGHDVREAAPQARLVTEERGIRPRPHFPSGRCGFFIFKRAYIDIF